MSAAAVFVDFGVVFGVGVDEGGSGAEFLENCVADDGGGAVGAVNGEIEVFEVDVFAEII